MHSSLLNPAHHFVGLPSPYRPPRPVPAATAPSHSLAPDAFESSSSSPFSSTAHPAYFVRGRAQAAHRWKSIMMLLLASRAPHSALKVKTQSSRVFAPQADALPSLPLPGPVAYPRHKSHPSSLSASTCQLSPGFLGLVGPSTDCLNASPVVLNPHSEFSLTFVNRSSTGRTP
ncbi:hypothetical protein L227DRAFT_364977 [Lentinus tigrinus ALCF2SS1-6]|uniref:Uncharacterized protein n=1 Tax=Lentinus tigrinus ALCF2SS1-6 TaxID=1328759 RepID=A0A5C2SKU0_9APHY|nr:hypothetical protein L227DRAFT_364977 [Lentinus tigrinus ALCF2SS1-6]